MLFSTARRQGFCICGAEIQLQVPFMLLILNGVDLAKGLSLEIWRLIYCPKNDLLLNKDM